jgi:hypothetical protein
MPILRKGREGRAWDAALAKMGGSDEKMSGEETIREDERQACWEDVLHVLEQAIKDKSKLRDVYQGIWLQGWKGFGTGDGKPMHRREDSHVNKWLGGQP